MFVVDYRVDMLMNLRINIYGYICIIGDINF